MLALGRLQTSVERLRDDFSEEKGLAHESRTAIHRRLDEQAVQVAIVDKTVALEALVHAQMRDQFETLAETVKENHDAVAPTIEDMRRLKMVGWGISGLIALGGISVGGLVALAGESVVNTLRHWLKIP